jgi:NAD-dependent dihydropyrimidine dehydrogenase PreA subunit
MYPVVDKDKCNGCGDCAEMCPSEVYQIEEDKSNPIHPEDCIECWACVNQCPTESIQLYEDCPPPSSLQVNP